MFERSALEIAINALILGVLILAALQFLASRSFRARGLSLGARLRVSPATVDASAALPPLVRDFALKSGAVAGAGLKTASYTQSGTFRLDKGGPMVPVSAWEVVALGSPGFLWEGRLDAGALRQVRTIDGLVDGKGHFEARLLGSVPLARVSGGDMTLGQTYRYLAELPWTPDAILGNPALAWRMVGPRSAEVSLAAGAGRAAVRFDFDAAGDIVGMSATGRPARDRKGGTTRMDWRGTFSDYAQIGPRRLPSQGEVGYVHPDGYEAYFIARIADYRLTE
ncbi:MAG: DUF6544 family protein [Paracoccaceae bacterium]